MLRERVTRINLNVYNDDLEFLQCHLGYGWSAKLRELIREYVRQLKKQSETKPWKSQ